MNIYKKLMRITSCFMLIMSVLNFTNYTLANELQTHNFKPNKQHGITGRLNRKQWNDLLKYSHEYVLKNKDSIFPEKNESGFFRINIKAPEALSKRLNIDKLRLHYWPIDKSNYIRDESIHNHPKYFESFIINGGYKHSIYKMNQLPIIVGARKLNLVRINKHENGTKTNNKLGNVYVNKEKDEIVKEGDITVMPTDVIHRVLFSVPGSLSMNVVYKDKHNKDYYNIMLTDNATDNDILTSRIQIKGKQKDKIVNEVEKRLLNNLFQRS